MSLRRWVPSIELGPFAFTERRPPSLAERLERLSDDELIERARVLADRVLEGMRHPETPAELFEEGAYLLRRQAPFLNAEQLRQLADLGVQVTT